MSNAELMAATAFVNTTQVDPNSCQPTSSTLPALMRRVKATADVVEAWISALDAVLSEFPEDIWGPAAAASAALESANLDIQSAVEDVGAAIKRSLSVGISD